MVSSNFERGWYDLFSYAYLEEEQLHIIIEDNGPESEKIRLTRSFSVLSDRGNLFNIGIRRVSNASVSSTGSRFTFSIASDGQTFTRILLSYPVKEDSCFRHFLSMMTYFSLNKLQTFLADLGFIHVFRTAAGRDQCHRILKASW